MRTSVCVISIVLLSGCQAFQSSLKEKGYLQPECQAEQPRLFISDSPCDILGWLEYRLSSEDVIWPERKKMIAELGNSHIDSLKKIILSQGMDTPYQSRLRAQNRLNDIMPQLSPKMGKLMNILLGQPNQKLLEYESALVTLGKINSRQSQAIDEQKMRLQELNNELQEQHNQIEELMKIETTLSNKDRQNDN